MALINKETGEQSASRSQQPSARERLQNLNTQSRAELENSLLKENLTEYTALFERLKNEQNSFLQQADQSLKEERKRNALQIEQMQKQVNELMEANKLLNANLSESIEDMTSAVKDATIQIVLEGLEEGKNDLKAERNKILNYEKKINNLMMDNLKEFEKIKDRFPFLLIAGVAGCILMVLMQVLQMTGVV